MELFGHRRGNACRLRRLRFVCILLLLADPWGLRFVCILLLLADPWRLRFVYIGFALFAFFACWLMLLWAFYLFCIEWAKNLNSV